MFDRDGSDAMRWFLMASPILRGGNLIVTEQGIREGVRQVLLPLWNTYYFFTLYAGGGRRRRRVHRAVPSTTTRVAGLPALDRYLLARTRDLVVTTHGAPGRVRHRRRRARSSRDHLDVLTNWYVRTQRDRFWDEDADAFDTLYTVLEVLTRVVAPLAPMVAEEVWRGLTGGRSVHLTDWPVAGEGALVADDALVAAMDQVRSVTSSALGLRKAHGQRVRQPLRTLTVAVDDPDALTPYAALLATELNVKQVQLVAADAGVAERFGIAQRLAVNARAAGPRLGRGVQAVIKAARAGSWRTDALGGVVVATDEGDVPLEPSEYELTTVVLVGDQAGDPAQGPAAAAAVLPGGGFVVLDLALDDALLAEGYARDVVRAVQDARKAAGLQVGDRIVLSLDVPRDRVGDVEDHQEFIGRETLAARVVVEVSPTPELVVKVEKVDA